MDDVSKKVRSYETILSQALGALEPYRSATSEIENMVEILRQNSALATMPDSVRQAMETLNGMGMTDGFQSQLKMQNSLFNALSVSSVSPLSQKVSDYVDTLQNSSLASVLSRYSLPSETMMQALAVSRYTLPSLNSSLASLIAQTELHGIGFTLASMPNFSDFAVDALRVDLGDWRSSIQFEPTSLLDPAKRRDFYLDRGLDPELTAFSAPAFRENLVSAGLLDEPEDHSVEAVTVDHEAEFMRTNEAHDRLMRFEFHLRVFINEKMTHHFGSEWVKHYVPGPMRQKWIDKKNQDQAREKTRPLIDYADFTDYVQIMIQNNNWREVFEVFFLHKPSVQESFRRLFPVRICTMHARPITQDDSLFLLVEIKRLSAAMELSMLTR